MGAIDSWGAIIVVHEFRKGKDVMNTAMKSEFWENDKPALLREVCHTEFSPHPLRYDQRVKVHLNFFQQHTLL